MFWKKTSPSHSVRYVAVLEIENCTGDTVLDDGIRRYRFKLADGTHEEMSIEASIWRSWQEGVLKGGFLLNP